MKNANKNMLITLGVRDVEKARKFYAGLGFKLKPNGYMADFEIEGIRFSLCRMDKLIEDVNI